MNFFIYFVATQMKIAHNWWANKFYAKCNLLAQIEVIERQQQQQQQQYSRVGINIEMLRMKQIEGKSEINAERFGLHSEISLW